MDKYLVFVNSYNNWVIRRQDILKNFNETSSVYSRNSFERKELLRLHAEASIKHMAFMFDAYHTISKTDALLEAISESQTYMFQMAYWMQNDKSTLFSGKSASIPTENKPSLAKENPSSVQENQSEINNVEDIVKDVENKPDVKPETPLNEQPTDKQEVKTETPLNEKTPDTTTPVNISNDDYMLKILGGSPSNETNDETDSRYDGFSTTADDAGSVSYHTTTEPEYQRKPISIRSSRRRRGDAVGVTSDSENFNKIFGKDTTGSGNKQVISRNANGSNAGVEAALINYWGDWCPASRAFRSVWEDFVTRVAPIRFPEIKFADINVKRDDIEAQESARSVKVTKFPTLVLFINGVQHNKVSAGLNVADITAFIELYM